MSRIDQALKRAGKLEEPPAKAEAEKSEPVNGEEVEPAEAALLESPWEFAAASDEVEAPKPPAEARVAPVPVELPPGPPPDEARPFALFQGFESNVAERLVVTNRMEPSSVEQYRRLAAALHHAQADRGIRVVMVGSALAGEGKTLTAVNLALTLSESYRRRVLLVDADLRRPTLHDVFRVPNISGLNDGLKADQLQKLSVIEISPNLSVLTAGRPDPDPMSGLTSDRMRLAITEAAAKFDWVIIDTPPVGLLPDANLLAAMVDVAVLVIRAAETPYALIQRAIEALGRERIIGVVLNRVSETGTHAGYSYYSYYPTHGGQR